MSQSNLYDLLASDNVDNVRLAIEILKGLENTDDDVVSLLSRIVYDYDPNLRWLFGRFQFRLYSALPYAVIMELRYRPAWHGPILGADGVRLVNNLLYDRHFPFSTRLSSNEFSNIRVIQLKMAVVPIGDNPIGLGRLLVKTLPEPEFKTFVAVLASLSDLITELESL